MTNVRGRTNDIGHRLYCRPGLPDVDAAGAGMARMISTRRLAVRVAVIVLILAVWEACARAHFVPIYFLPSLSAVLQRTYQDLASGALITAAYYTLVRTLAGFGLAAAFGIVVGVMIARIPLVRWFCDPLVSIGLPLPKIAFLPIFVLWFGVFEESKILMIAFSAVFPVIVLPGRAPSMSTN